MQIKVNVWSIFDLLSPACPACGLANARGPGRLCPGCQAELPRDGGGITPPPLDRVVAACAYAFPVDRLVQQLKFGGRLPLARPLGQLLVEAVRAQDAPRPHALVPVPMHPARERQRGFNQADVLARAAGRVLGIPADAHAVQRVRDTAAQSGLDLHARRHNLQHAFILCAPLPPHVAIIDDVTTTGSTLAAVAEVLRAGGVQRVDAWVVARTP